MPINTKHTHRIFLIDPKNIVLSGGIDTLNRHQIYADKVENTGSNSRLNEFKVLCNHDKKFEEFQEKYRYLVSSHKKRKEKHVIFLLTALKVIKKNRSDSVLLVSGDPWQAAVYCIILKFLIKDNTKVQVQVHADIGDKRWRKKSLKNYIKFYLSFFTLKRADSIRCVSETQLRKIKEKFKATDSKLFCSGILYNVVSAETTKVNNFRILTVGFVGRLETDRGIWDYIRIIKKLNSLGTKIDIKIAGDGKLRSQFISKLKKINSGTVDYLGHLLADEISTFWKAIDLSIFTAPTESFGRGMRESLANRVPVWAVNSSGFEDLKSKFETVEIVQIDPFESAESLGKKLETTIKLKIDYNYRDYFMKEQKMDLDRLIHSWVLN